MSRRGETAGRASDSPSRGNDGPGAELGRGLLAIAGLSSLAIAQPVYDLLRRTPEFFAIRQLGVTDLLALIILLLFGPALALSVPALAARFGKLAWIRPAVAWPAGLLAGVIALQAARDLPAAVAISLGAAVCAGVTWAYVRLSAARFLASVLAIAAVAVPAILVLDGDVRRSLSRSAGQAATQPTGAQAPVVLVVFDEWSVVSILDREGRIDRQRLPHLARLADQATWYPEATAASNMTNHAVPAMLTGLRPEREQLPIAEDHPINLFTLLAPSHDVVALEQITTLCPPRLNRFERLRPSFVRRLGLLVSDLRFVWLSLTLPEPWAGRLPPLDRAWSGFGGGRAGGDGSGGGLPPDERELARTQPHRRNDERVADFHRFVDSLAPPGERPGLYFAHVLLPHGPWEYLPSGRRFGRSRSYGLHDGIWTTDPFTVRNHEKRYLLQVQFVDRLIGELIAKLEALDLFDRSVIAITADHGLSFQPGKPLRLPGPDRSADQLLDLVSVPLIVKAPFQDEARIDDREFSMVDLMPTILELAGARPGAETGGRSGNETAGRSGAETGARLDAEAATRSDTGTDARPGTETATRPSARTGGRLDAEAGARSSNETGARPGDRGRDTAQRPPTSTEPLWFGEHTVGFELPADRSSWRRARVAAQAELLGEANDPARIGTLSNLHGRAVADLPLRSDSRLRDDSREHDDLRRGNSLPQRDDLRQRDDPRRDNDPRRRDRRQNGDIRARFDLPHAWDDVDPGAILVPAVVEAKLIGPEERSDRSVVVAVNGIVADSVRPYTDRQGSRRISALLPDDLLRPGRNLIELFLASERNGVLEIERLGPPERLAYQVDTRSSWTAERNAAGLVGSLLRRPVDQPDEAPERFQVVRRSRNLFGNLEATAAEQQTTAAGPGPGAAGRDRPRDSQADPHGAAERNPVVQSAAGRDRPRDSQGRWSFRLNGRAFDAEAAGTAGTAGQLGTIVVLVDGDAVAFTGPPLGENGFTTQFTADRERIERSGVVAYAVGNGGRATRLRFSYRPIVRDDSGREVLPVSDGRRLVVSRPGDGYAGAVDRIVVAGKETRISVWAADLEREEPPRQVVIYRDGEFLGRLGPMKRDRSDVAERFGAPALLRSGFNGTVPGAPLPSAFPRRHRVFAVMDRGAAIELPIPPPSGNAGPAQ